MIILSPAHRNITRLSAAVVVLALLSASAHAVTITRGPYIQNLKSNSAVIVWVTDIATVGTVDYGLTTSYTATVSDPGIVTQHAITLTGLQMATLYHYQARDNVTTLTNDLTFHSGKDATFNSFTFGAMGDHRIDSANPNALANVASRLSILDPEIIIDTGDYTTDGTNASGWDPQFFTPTKDVISRSCLFSAIGNHEGNALNYISYFYPPTDTSGSKRYYSFDYAQAHFSVVDVTTTYGVGTPQYAWLAADLAGNKNKQWLFVAFHNPPYSSGAHGPDASVQSQLCPLLEQNGVDMVFNGHDHDYEHALVNGVHYIVTGGGGAPLYAVSPHSWTITATSAWHCCLVNVNGGILTLTAMKPDGTVIDTFPLSATRVADWNLY
jgi:acid phosphatase type 7